LISYCSEVSGIHINTIKEATSALLLCMMKCGYCFAGTSLLSHQVDGGERIVRLWRNFLKAQRQDVTEGRRLKIKKYTHTKGDVTFE